MNTVALWINQMHFRRETGDLPADDEVDIKIEPISLKRLAISFLHFPHF